MSSLLGALSQMPLVVGAKEHDEPGHVMDTWGMLELGGNGIRQNAQHMRQGDLRDNFQDFGKALKRQWSTPLQVTLTSFPGIMP